VIHKDNPYVGVTEHYFDENTKLAIMINYSPEVINTAIGLKDGWKMEKVVYGDDAVIKEKTYVCKIAANDAMIVYLNKIQK
jgi:hypothetical protein